MTSNGNRYPAEMWAQARQMRANGATQQAIAEALGISQHTVHQWLKRDDPPLNYKTRSRRGPYSRGEPEPPVPPPKPPQQDPRTTTGRLMGDPMPGRSALDMRQQNER